MKLRTYAIDDIPKALECLTQLIAMSENLELVGSSSNPVEGLKELLDDSCVDLLFLDIEMPGLDGIAIGKALAHTDTSIVLTTGYNNFAAEAFGINAIDYLIKPFTYDRFLLSISKVWEYKHLHDKRFSEEETEYLFVPGNGKNNHTKVFVKDIQYIKAERNYSHIIMTDSKIFTYSTISDFEATLPPSRFLRVHRSYLVNIHFIRSVKYHELTLEYGKETIPISENHWKKVSFRLGLK